MTNRYRRWSGVVALVVALAVLVVAGPTSAAGYSGGIAPTVLGGRLDMNGSGGVGGRDDSNAFYGSTDVIDGAIDCNTWGSTPNAGSAGDDVIDTGDDCTMIGADGTVDGVTIVVEDGLVTTVDDAPIRDGYVMPAIFNASNPTDDDVAHADFGWVAIDGRVDANANGSIDDGDCMRGVVGQRDDIGLGVRSDGADVLGASSLCANSVTQPSTVDGLVDLDSDHAITGADTCDACFVGQNVVSGFVGGVAGPMVVSFSPTSGPVGTTVTITGIGLAEATEVRFNGIAGTIGSNTDTTIVVTVPNGATTGPVTVVTRNGQTASGSPFTVTTTPPPGGTHERAVVLELHGRLSARGSVSVVDGATACGVGVDVRVQRKIGRRWRTIQGAQTRRNMTFVAILPNFPGRYRAFLPTATLSNGEDCASARSPVVRR